MGSGRQRAIIWVGVVTGVLLVVAVSLAALLLQRSPKLADFVSAEAGVRLSYDARLRSISVKGIDKQNHVVLGLEQPQGASQALQISVRYESGLRPIATVAKQDIRDTLLSSITKTYPKRFKDYTKLSQRDFALNSHKASELTFRYSGPSGQVIRQRFLLVVVSDDKAIYVSAQAKEQDYADLNKKYFDTTFASLRLE